MVIEFDTCLQMFAPRYDSNIQVYQAPDYKPVCSSHIWGQSMLPEKLGKCLD